MVGEGRVVGSTGVWSGCGWRWKAINIWMEGKTWLRVVTWLIFGDGGRRGGREDVTKVERVNCEDGAVSGKVNLTCDYIDVREGVHMFR